MAERQQDIETLKRRGRRRLVGAVALVLAAVIVLPMVFEPEPRKSAPPVSVRIPGENEAPFKPKAVPKPPEKKAEEKKAEAKAEPPPPPPPAEKKVAVAKPAPAKPAAPKPAPSERARAEAALAGAEYVFQVGVYADPTNAIETLKAAKLNYSTEKVNNLTRVRAGPFATKEAAEKARERVKGLGLEPGTVSTKAG
ncbi:MAG TPA: SPOR domain-containing protein [Burkholderiales bacterium]|jgi:DedD protein